MILIPACVLWRTLIEISSAVSDSAMRAISRRPASTQRRPVDAVDEADDALLVGSRGRRTRARPRRARASRSPQRGGADGVQRADAPARRRGPSPGACWAAEPCHTPSMRVARPPTAAASGTVASTRSWPLAQRALEVGQRLGLVAEGHAEHDDLGPARPPRRSRGPRSARRAGRARARSAASTARPRRASRATTGTPARPQRSVRPKPSAPVAPMIAMGSVTGGEYMFRAAR